MRQFKNMTEGEKIVESIFGLILGTIFIFGMGHWNAPVTRAEARNITATFSSFQESRKRGEVREIILRFDDHEQMYIDGQCIDEALCAEIEALEHHTVVRLLAHPNSNIVLEMTVGGDNAIEPGRICGEVVRRSLWIQGIGLRLLCACHWRFDSGYRVEPEKIKRVAIPQRGQPPFPS